MLSGKVVSHLHPSHDLFGLGTTPRPAANATIRKSRRRPASQPAPAASAKQAPEPPAIETTASSQREIKCLECAHAHHISAHATSSVCPRCDTRVSLEDYQINEEWTRRILTHGDIHVTRQGSIRDVTVHCDNLTVDGDFTGGVECNGDFTIRRHGEIHGRVRCKRLIIEKKAEVTFTNTVHADEVIIDGMVRGDIHCKGRLDLKKLASLHGDIQIASLSIAEGARHNGMVRMSRSSS